MSLLGVLELYSTSHKLFSEARLVVVVLWTSQEVFIGLTPQVGFAELVLFCHGPVNQSLAKWTWVLGRAAERGALSPSCPGSAFSEEF